MLIDWPLFCWITLGLLVAASLLHLLPYSGKARESLLDACCRAPLLDGIVCYFTILPLVVGPLVSGWAGLVSGAFAQLATLLIWHITSMKPLKMGHKSSSASLDWQLLFLVRWPEQAE